MHEFRHFACRQSRLRARLHSPQAQRFAIGSNALLLALWSGPIQGLPLGAYEHLRIPLTMLWSQLYWPVLTLLAVTLTLRLVRRTALSH